jgi:hypothetical protein
MASSKGRRAKEALATVKARIAKGVGAANSRPASAARASGARRSSARADAGRVAKAARPTAPAAAPVGTAAPGERVRIARVAKGRRPQYFSDPAIDKLLWITMTLAGELSVTRDRLDAVERLLERRRVLKVADVDAYEPTPEAEAAREARRQDYLDRVLRAVQAELEEVTGRDMPKSQDEVVAAVAS